MTPTKPRGFGITAGFDHALIADLGQTLSRLGYGSFWSNDTEAGDGIAAVAAVADSAPELQIGLGVLSLDRHSAADIAADPRLRQIGSGRLVIGLGVGDSSAPLALARRGIIDLRSRWPEVTIYLAALGPRMCQLAGELADGVLLNWVTPARVTWARERVAEGAQAVGRGTEDVKIWAYVRTVVGPDAKQRLELERATYDPRRITANHYRAYRNQFRTMDYSQELIGAASPTIPESFRLFDSVLDGAIVRAVPASRSLAGLVEIAESAAPNFRAD